MSISKLIPGTLALVGLLLAGLPANAQSKEPAVTLKPMEDLHLPAGSQISEERLKQMDVKARAYKARLKAQKLESSKKTLPNSDGEQR
jgi:hypothetical protein